jgi:cytochrome c peroxidase
MFSHRSFRLALLGFTTWAGLISAAPLAAAPVDPALLTRAQALFKPIPVEVKSLRGNLLTAERAELGRLLFFEPRLSQSGTISCFTCHNLGMGGDDNLPTSVGHRWQKGPRNAPTVYNAVFNAAQFWDGRAAELKAQAKGPIQTGVEMASTPEAVVATLRSMPDYVQRFQTAFPGSSDPITFDHVAQAIEAFEATLLTPDSAFDRLLNGDANALTAPELAGLAHFIDKGCVACHGGINLGGQGYFPFGVIAAPADAVRPPADHGRFAVTKTETDDYVFRAAPLRNVALTAPYFHSGQVWDLKEAVAIMGSSQLGATLTASETEEITAFLLTLTGTAPAVQIPTLPVETATTPRPQL